MTLDSFNEFQSHGALMPSITAAFIMFTITVVMVSAFFLPATYERKSPVVNFYWVGVWMFLGLILCISGAQQTVRMLGIDASDFSELLLLCATLSLVIFVMFGWFRLSGLAMVKAFVAVRAHRRGDMSGS